MDLTNLNRDRKQRRKSAPDLSTMIYGKIPPQAKDLEEAILGALMMDESAYDVVGAILKPETFYVESHQRIYSAIADLQNKSSKVDTLTVAERLREKEELDMVGGPYYIVKLTNSVVSGAHIEAHAKIVHQKFIGREMIRIGGEMISDAYEDSTDVFDTLERAESALSECSIKGVGAGLTHVSNVVVKAVQELEERRKRKSHITGIASGYDALDRTTLGFQNGELIILAGRPGEGKTALAVNIAANAALNKEQAETIAIWSLEMKATRLVDRMISARSNVPLTRILSGRMDDETINILYKKGISVIGQSDIYFDEQTGINVQQIKAKARKYKRKHGLKLIIVDYLQLISEKEGFNREQQISNISRQLKTLSLELDIPIIALSQLSRAVENRAGKVPQLSDLRESGAIEQDADMVIFIWKPTEKEIEDNPSLAGKTRIKVAKQRNGVENLFICDFDKSIQLIHNLREENATVPELPLTGAWRPVETTDFTIPKHEQINTEDDD